MNRKNITQLFPWFLPIRKKQKKLFFYTKMQFDKNHYTSRQIEQLLPCRLFSSSCLMYNSNTGFDMVYQENKVFNLKLAAVTLDKLLIQPGETFSLWNRLHHADRQLPYKDGLAEVNGRLMHRIGESADHFDQILAMFHMEHLIVTGIYTHLCTADDNCDASRLFTEKQATAFQKITDHLKQQGYFPKTHLLSSYGLLNYPQYGGSYARIGIALYGVLSTKSDAEKCPLDLRPVLSLKTRIASIRKLPTGESAGYAMAYTATKDTTIAAPSIGYADGLPRSLSCGIGHVLINGKKAPVIGRICMDQTLVDITNIPDIHAGGTAVIIGRQGSHSISAYDIAAQTDTITNEVLSSLGTRLERVKK